MDQIEQPFLQSFLDKMNNRKLDRHGLIGSSGYSIPRSSELQAFSFEDIRKGALKNIRIIGNETAANNFVLAHGRCALRAELRIHTSSKTNNAVLVLGEALTLHGDVRIFATDQTVIFSGGIAEVGHAGLLGAHLWADGDILYIGTGTTSNGSSYSIAGGHRSIIVGDDCMFAHGVHIATSDMHAVADMATCEMLNHPGDVVIEPHVWLGRNTTIGKNVVVGLGSVVGAHALVLHDCPRFSMNGGVPAKVLRTGVTWDRKATLRTETVNRIVALGKAVPQHQHSS